MSNALSVRRVKFQTLDESGNPEGDPTFGVLAADGYEQSYMDIFQSFEELNTAIDEVGCILSVLDDANQKWPEANLAAIGTDNYYGKDWTQQDE